MNIGTIILLVVCALVVCCAFTHRRVIKALVNHDVMPKAPKWHWWINNRYK